MIIQLKNKIQRGYLKLFFTLVFLVICSFSFSQTKENSTVYQDILNHPDFIKIIENDTSLLCNGTLVYKSGLTEDSVTLKFKDKKLTPVTSIQNNKCSLLSFSQLPSKKKFTLKTTINDFKNEELNGKCLSSQHITFECKVKRKKSTYKIIKTETKYWRSNALLL